MHDVDGGEKEREGASRETPPKLLLSSPCAYVGGLTFPSLSLRKLSVIAVLYCSVFFCRFCSDETFFLMLKLLLVFCDGCSLHSAFCCRGTSPLRGGGGGEGRRGRRGREVLGGALGSSGSQPGSFGIHLIGRLHLT